MSRAWSFLKLFLIVFVPGLLVCLCISYLFASSIASSQTNTLQMWHMNGRNQMSFEMQPNKQYFIDSDSPMTISARGDREYTILSTNEAGRSVKTPTEDVGSYVIRDEVVSSSALWSSEKITVEIKSPGLVTVYAQYSQSHLSRTLNYFKIIALVMVSIWLGTCFFFIRALMTANWLFLM